MNSKLIKFSKILIRWELLSGLNVTDGIGPNTDHQNSVLGNYVF